MSRTLRLPLRILGLIALSCAAASTGAHAQECPGNPGALGTSRVLTIDPAEFPRIGTVQYQKSLPLQDKEVVLTFDDGPMPPYTNRVLEVLAEQCVKANYFIIGRMARGYPDLMRQIKAAGHVIGTHSQNHPLAFERMPVNAIQSEVEQGIASVAAALADRNGVAPFFRIPGLLRAPHVESYLQSRGLVAWSADVVADDWKHISAADVVRRTMARLEEKGKGIVLLHDIQPATALAMPELLRQLKAHGYKIVVVAPGKRGAPVPVAAIAKPELPVAKVELPPLPVARTETAPAPTPVVVVRKAVEPPPAPPQAASPVAAPVVERAAPQRQAAPPAVIVERSVPTPPVARPAPVTVERAAPPQLAATPPVVVERTPPPAQAATSALARSEPDHDPSPNVMEREEPPAAVERAERTAAPPAPVIERTVPAAPQTPAVATRQPEAEPVASAAPEEDTAPQRPVARVIAIPQPVDPEPAPQAPVARAPASEPETQQQPRHEPAREAVAVRVAPREAAPTPAPPTPVRKAEPDPSVPRDPVRPYAAMLKPASSASVPGKSISVEPGGLRNAVTVAVPRAGGVGASSIVRNPSNDGRFQDNR